MKVLLVLLMLTSCAEQYPPARETISGHPIWSPGDRPGPRPRSTTHVQTTPQRDDPQATVDTTTSPEQAFVIKKVDETAAEIETLRRKLQVHQDAITQKEWH